MTILPKAANGRMLARRSWELHFKTRANQTKCLNGNIRRKMKPQVAIEIADSRQEMSAIRMERPPSGSPMLMSS